MLKRCPEHGHQKVLLADDVEYYRRCREVFIKPPEMPVTYNTPVKWGCPYDCGLCTDHEQHSCLSLVEICDACNLECPICYAESSPARQQFRTLDQVAFMLDAVVRNEGEPDIVQISGGEPTLHPEFFAVLDLAKQRPIRHLMVNTNGVRIAEDAAFCERLASYMPNLEVYLQFDSFQRAALLELRGADLRDVRERAVERLNRCGISTTLVVTLKKGLNDGEIGHIIDYALEQPCVRGVTFQPIQAAGRLEHFNPATDRLTLTEVRRRGRNTILYEQDDRVRDAIFKLFATNHSPQSGANSLRELLCCLPRVSAPPGITYENLFRVLIVQFIDAYAFDVRSVKKTCVHIVHPDERLIPFDTYNLFYRDGLEQTRLEPLRRQVEAGTAYGL